MSVTYQMMLLSDHETKAGEGIVLCGRCGNYLVNYPDPDAICAHCFVAETESGVQCPVCQESEIPRVFFDSDMREELARLKAARAQFSSTRSTVS